MRRGARDDGKQEKDEMEWAKWSTKSCVFVRAAGELIGFGGDAEVMLFDENNRRAERTDKHLSFTALVAGLHRLAIGRGHPPCGKFSC